MRSFDAEGKLAVTTILNVVAFASGVYGGFQVSSTIDNVTSDPNSDVVSAAADLGVTGTAVYAAIAADIASRSLWGVAGIIVGAELYSLLNNDAQAKPLTSCP